MIPARRLLRRRLRGPGARALAVLDLGADVSSVWSPATGVVSAPSRVAVDPDGTVEGFGGEADRLAGEGRHRLATVNPFAPGEWQDRLVRSYLAWLVRGTALCTGATVFLLPPDSVSAGHGVVGRAVEDMGCNVLEFHRPLAAAVALGLPVDEADCHFMAEVSESHVDLAVIRAGSVVLGRRVPRDDDSIRSVTSESLRMLDPDDDLEIRARGVHLYGWSAPRHTGDMLAALDLPLAGAVGSGATVLDGGRLLAEEVLPWLTAEEWEAPHRGASLLPRR